MSLIALLPDLPGCSVDQVSQTEESIVITASATTSSASCPSCQQVSSHVHSTYIRSPKALPSSGRPVRLQLQVRRFRCATPTCRRKTFAETFPLLIGPRAQRTSAAHEVVRVIGEAIGGRAGARLCQHLALKCSFATVLRLVHQAALPSSENVRVVGVDEWAWRKGQRYGTILVDLERRVPIDLLEDATAESFAAWLERHPTVEVVSRDWGTTFADGAHRGAPGALQIADRWHIIKNMGEALEKVLARYHADVKRAMAPAAEEEQQIIAALDQQALARTSVRSQKEQQRQARQERRRKTFMRVQELAAQGWSGASIARMLGIHKKTAVKYATADHFPQERSDRGRKLAPYLPFLHTMVRRRTQHRFSVSSYSYSRIHCSETAMRNYLTALRKQIGQESHSRRYYPPVSQEKKHHQQTVLSSRRATWVALRKPETRSAKDQQLLLLLQQAHPQVRMACELAQAFVQMIRERNAPALEPWLQEATESGVPELRTFAHGIKRDQDAIQAALTYEWSQGQVEGQVHRLKLLKRQSYGRAEFELLRHRVLARSA